MLPPSDGALPKNETEVIWLAANAPEPIVVTEFPMITEVI